MKLTLNVRHEGPVTVLDLSGRLVMSEESNLFRETIRNLLADSRKHILLNFSGVEYIDSSGIGALVEAVVLTANEGGKVKLTNLQRMVHSTLAVHRLIQVFQIYNSEADALASFQTKA